MSAATALSVAAHVPARVVAPATALSVAANAPARVVAPVTTVGLPCITKKLVLILIVFKCGENFSDWSIYVNGGGVTGVLPQVTIDYWL